MGRETVDGYELGERVGEGGTAEVYRARAPDGRTVAVKLVAARAREQGAVAARFRREIGALARLSHPNLIALLDHGEHAQLGPYIVSPLIDGVTVGALAGGRALGPPDAALVVLHELLAGLAALHAAGLVHRDVKPDNAMVTARGELVLLDLGLAWHDELTRCTEEGAVAGSVPYMSPEQVEGRAVTPASDVWSVGVVAYELVTGQRPFARRRQGEEVAAILAGACERLEARERRVSPAFAELVHRCLTVDPDARPRDAAGVLAAVRRELAGWLWPAGGDGAGEAETAAVRQALARLVADREGFAREVTAHRVGELRRAAQDAIAAGDRFGAIALLDRALAYDPDDDDAQRLVETAAASVSPPPPVSAAPVEATPRDTGDLSVVRTVHPSQPDETPGRRARVRRAATTSLAAAGVAALVVAMGLRLRPAGPGTAVASRTAAPVARATPAVTSTPRAAQTATMVPAAQPPPPAPASALAPAAPPPPPASGAATARPRSREGAARGAHARATSRATGAARAPAPPPQGAAPARGLFNVLEE